MVDAAEHLTRTERDQSFPYLRPKDAATIILIDRSGAEPKVLMGRRHHGHKFMPGKFVFPGGRVEAHDRYVPVGGELDPSVESRLMQRLRRPSRIRARVLAVAAIREASEETGLLLGTKVASVPKFPDDAFAEAGVQPSLDELHFIARAITPPHRPRRFDTRFFAADARAIAHRVEGIIGPDAELVELIWVPIAAAKELDLPSITHVVLVDLEARIAAGFGHDLPVPYYRMVSRRFVRELL
ncbi:MAG: NUDIX hydrolase [Alphaproteobacteria bacterium]|nr:MAG: NUDIX hydrolase [Alphaproteobacteria bacterium]